MISSQLNHATVKFIQKFTSYKHATIDLTIYLYTCTAYSILFSRQFNFERTLRFQRIKFSKNDFKCLYWLHDSEMNIKRTRIYPASTKFSIIMFFEKCIIKCPWNFLMNYFWKIFYIKCIGNNKFLNFVRFDKNVKSIVETNGSSCK